VAIFEPFVNNEKLDGYRKFLGFPHCISNCNGQIWCFWNVNCHSVLIAEDEQHITIKFEDGINNHNSYISAVYAKYTSTDRKDL